MAWNYRKKIKIAPGVHLNFSKKGVSTSIGPKGAKVTFGKNGTYMSTSIPGTGLYSRQKISGCNSNTSCVEQNDNNNSSGCLKNIGLFFSIILLIIGLGISITTQNANAIFIGTMFIAMSLAIIIKYVLICKDQEASIECQSDTGDNKETVTDTHINSLGHFDPLLEDAALLLIQSGTGNTSTIQRNFSVGYNRAGRIIDQLEEIGVIGPARDSASRELLIHDSDEWLILKSRLLLKLAKKQTCKENTTDNSGISLSYGLTEDQFNLIQSASDNLSNFVSKIGRKRNVKGKVDEMLQLENNDGSPWTVTKKMQIATFADIYRCYNGLGHNFSLDDEEENIGIYLFMGKILKPDLVITFDTISQCKNILKDSFAGVLEISDLLNQNTKMASNEFFLQKVLGECDRELQTQYMTLLFRFASAVAKADGQVNETEEKWLSEIMKSQETNIGNGSNVRTTTKYEQDPLESPCEMLNNLIGLASVKEEITKLTNFIKIQQVRESNGLKTPDISYHCVFTGNPGTGKTTVARIMASIYKDLGILKKGHLIETDRSGLVAEYVGQTAVKTNKIIDSALDGVLFIDEAYSLVQGAKEDFGQEAISTLLKRMEDDRNRLIVILAGYGSEMKTYIDSNPGLQSRFNRYIHFPDYTAKELEQIFLLNAKNNQYTLSEETLLVLEDMMSYAIEHKDKNFGNARFVRNLFEKSIQNQATRLSYKPCITTKELSELTTTDLPANLIPNVES